MDTVNLRKFESLSPFEIKNDLMEIAKRKAKTSDLAFLNAGRGNPNWIATEPREGFFLLGQFAISESKRVLDLPPGVGGMPQADGSAERLTSWLAKHSDMPGAEFLRELVPFAVKRFGFDADAFVHELVDSIIGDNYPVPDRMLVHNEQIVREYLRGRCAASRAPRARSSSTPSRAAPRRCVTCSESLRANRLLQRG